MVFDSVQRRSWASGALIALLGLLGIVMAFLQYRWTGELSRAEQERLREALQRSLSRLAGDFDRDLATAIGSLQPTASEIEQMGRAPAYAARYTRWRSENPDSRLFAAIGLGVPDGVHVTLHRLDQAQGQFSLADWPAPWSALRDQLAGRMRGERFFPANPEELLFEIPRFARGSSNSTALAEQEWLIVELNLAYLCDVLLPAQVARHLSSGDAAPYRVEVYSGKSNTVPVYRAGLAPSESLRHGAQATVRLLESPRPSMMRGGRPGGFDGYRGGRDGRRPRFDGDGAPGGPRPFGSPKGPPPDRRPSEAARGTWQMLVSPPGGSLETLVERSRWRNLALALTLLTLILATAFLLIRSARQSQQLAELQMNFVSSVSHELRTPLTVIRTAAFNLRGQIAAKPDQVERYGKLIQEQSEKLGALVEQVLRYASSRAGQVIQEREAVVIDDVIEGGIRSSQLALETSAYQLEKQIDPGLPLVLADERALQHVIQNLLDNAVKYGTESSSWIGLRALRAGNFVEIRVADRGPGIPADEQALVFDPFFRGRRALADQIHGTGLGLNLVKKIVEAHGGTIRVQPHSPCGSEFIVQVPIAPPEMQDEFAHTAG